MQEAAALPTVIVCGQETTDEEIYSRETTSLPLAAPVVSQAQQPAAEKLLAQDSRGTWTQMLDSWQLDSALEQQLDQTVPLGAARQKRMLKWGALGAGLALAAGLLWAVLSSEPPRSEGPSAQPARPALEAVVARESQVQPRSEPLRPSETTPPPPAALPRVPVAASAAASGSGQSAPARRLQRKRPQRAGARARVRRPPRKKRLQVRYDRQNNVVEILLPEGAPEPQIQVKQQPGQSK